VKHYLKVLTLNLAPQDPPFYQLAVKGLAGLVTLQCPIFVIKLNTNNELESGR